MLIAFLGPSLRCTYSLRASQEGVILTAMFLGIMAGSPLWGFVSDAFGRKLALRISSLLCLLATVLTALAPAYAVVVFAATMSGVGVSGAVVAFSLYAELTPTKIRAMGMVGVELSWTIGAVRACRVRALDSHACESRALVCAHTSTVSHPDPARSERRSWRPSLRRAHSCPRAGVP